MLSIWDIARLHNLAPKDVLAALVRRELRGQRNARGAWVVRPEAVAAWLPSQEAKPRAA